MAGPGWVEDEERSANRGSPPTTRVDNLFIPLTLEPFNLEPSFYLKINIDPAGTTSSTRILWAAVKTMLLIVNIPPALLLGISASWTSLV